jgi:hypothetical protein
LKQALPRVRKSLKYTYASRNTVETKQSHESGTDSYAKTILRKLERMTPAQIGAWFHHSQKYFEQHEPDLSLEYPPAPIPTAALEEKPVNPRLAQLL